MAKQKAHLVQGFIVHMVRGVAGSLKNFASARRGGAVYNRVLDGVRGLLSLSTSRRNQPKRRSVEALLDLPLRAVKSWLTTKHKKGTPVSEAEAKELFVGEMDDTCLASLCLGLRF